MISQPTFAEIARRFILFEPRIDAGTVAVELREVTSRHRVIGLFLASLERIYPNVRLDDLALIVLEFLRNYPRLDHWYDYALSGLGLQIRFERGEPLVMPERDVDWVLNSHAWLDLCASIDPDVLITLQYARRFRRRPQTAELVNWGTYARIFDPEVLGLPMGLRFRDVHTHLSGCEPAPHVWATTTTLARLPAYADDRMDPAHAEELASERNRVARARREWRRLSSAVDVPPARAAPATDALSRLPSDVAPQFGGSDEADYPYWADRYRLIEFWRAFIEWHDEGTPRIVGRPPAAEAWEHRGFDEYLHARNLFTRRHIQSPHNNPGLEAFRRSFDFLKPIRASKSRRVVSSYIDVWRKFAYETASIDHIEFRIAPMPSVKAYADFFATLHGVFKKVSENPPRPAIGGRGMPRFVVHFVRPRLPPDRMGTGLELSNLRNDLDQKCAALHAFLHQKERTVPLGHLRPLIVGIDVCNLERNAPIEHYAPYLNAVRHLKRSATDEAYFRSKPSYFRRWYAASAMHGRSGAAAPLGLTLHAGEDYYHPLIGLREVWNAVILCDMKSGDRLGHALALGIDVRAEACALGAYTVVPTGAILDAAVWLWRRVGTLPTTDPRVGRDLLDVIDALSRAVFSRSVQPMELYHAITMRQYPLTRQEFDRYASRLMPELNDEQTRRTVHEDAFDQRTLSARARLMAIPAQLSTDPLLSAIEQVQALLLSLVIRRHLIIEMNPSSNRAVGGFQTMAEHPILRLKLLRPELRVTVACDDPGNFGTRIENEFALVASGIRELGHDSGVVDETIRDLVETGRVSAFGRLTFSNDTMDWQGVRRTDPEVRHHPESGPD